MEKYYKHKVNDLIVIKNIVTVHYFEFDKNFISHGESHNFWELVYAEKEDIYCVADGREFTLSQGELYFHKPNEFHVLKANGKKAPNVFITSFDCNSNAMNYFNDKKIKLNKQYIPLIYNIINEAKNTFNIPISNPASKKMELNKKPTLGGLQLIKNYLETLLINVMRDETENQNSVFLQDEEFSKKLVNDVLAILKNNIYNSITIDEICKQLSYCKSQIYKQFKKYTGKGIIEYLIKLKIEKAKQLIRENELSVKEISDKLCFDTPNYFSKTFKKIVGTNPLQYKKITNNQLK